MTEDAFGTLDALLDRLVDDELSEPQRQRLLLRLEAEVDGWRRCALRFLEAQAFRRAMKELCGGRLALSITTPRASDGAGAGACASTVEGLPSAAVAGGDVQAGVLRPGISLAEPAGPKFPSRSMPLAELEPAREPGARRLRWQGLAMAASVALAFALGMSVRSWLIDSTGPGTPKHSQLAADEASGSQANGGPMRPQQHAWQPGAQQAGVVADDGRGGELRPWGKMRFVSQRPDGQSEVVELPVYEGASLEEHLARVQQTFPHEYIEQLRRAGYEVRNEAELIPFDLEDGRQLIVPAQRIEVVPAGYRPMQ